MSNLASGTLGNFTTAAAGTAVDISHLEDVTITVTASADLDASAAGTIEVQSRDSKWMPTATSSAFDGTTTPSGTYTLTGRVMMVRFNPTVLGAGSWSVRYSGRARHDKPIRTASLGDLTSTTAGSWVDVSELDKLQLGASGTFSGTLTFEGTNDGGSNTVVLASLSSAAGSVVFAVPPAKMVRAKFSAYSSGTAYCRLSGARAVGKQRFGTLGAFPLAAYISTTPSAPTVTPTGGAGGNNYGYKIVAIGSDAGHTPVSTEGTTSAGPAALGAEAYNTITGTAVTGAASYDVYRTTGGATQGKIGNVTNIVTGLKDDGLEGDGGTAPTDNTTGLGAGTAVDVSDLDSISIRVAHAGTVSETLVVEGSADGEKYAPLAAALTASGNVTSTSPLKFIRANMTVHATGTSRVLFGGVNNDLRV